MRINIKTYQYNQEINYTGTSFLYHSNLKDYYSTHGLILLYIETFSHFLSYSIL